MRDARKLHASLPISWRNVLRRLLALTLLLASAWASPADAQARPWLDWRTVETEHFTFHFPEEYRVWTLALAERMEGVRSQVRDVVGYTTDRKVQVVIDDPSNESNGTAFTALDAPTIVLFPTPPDPRQQIGNFRVWGELLATHEFAHVAHLTRPSRNRWKNLLWAVSPVPLGPIALSSPRWVLEGYATLVEGRVTGTGRPNHAWRAAVLRQFALAGRLPSYAELNATGGWETGSFAYLAGSAYLEWLARREGDSSVTALWRRMTAKTTRSFDQAFVGVYGASAQELYARFMAELTADAVTIDRAIPREPSVSGQLVQRLARNTGDPAVSPDGRFVALTVRRIGSPSSLVVWKTTDDADTAAVARRERQLQLDPDDVPDRSFGSPPKRPVISLMAEDGAPYESPRWMADNRHLLVTRRMPASDGTVRPDLFIWSAEDGSVSRVTREAALRDGDPSPDSQWAAAVRCEHGFCDLVRVNLATGAIRVLVPGSPTRNFYRPRVSRLTSEIVAAEQSGDRWRIVRVDPVTGAFRYADPDDGATRYDASFERDGKTIVTTSEAGGLANLERLSIDGRLAHGLTAVTGAAVAADAAPDGAIWFLSLQASGYDLRRIISDSASMEGARMAATAMRLALADTVSAVLPRRRIASSAGEARRPAVGPVSSGSEYDYGPSRLRYLPGFTTGFGGVGFQLALVRSDPVGRFGVSFVAAAGPAPLAAGVSMEVRDRRQRRTRVVNVWSTHEAPSRQFGPALLAGLDLARLGGGVRIEQTISGDGGEMLASLGTIGEWQRATGFDYNGRGAAVGTFTVVRRQRDESSRFIEQLSALGEVGGTGGGFYYRQRTTFSLGTGSNVSPLSFGRIAYGTIGGGEGATRERFAIGGMASSLFEPTYDARRVDAPAYPVGSAASRSFLTYRISAPLPPVELFFSAASPDVFKTEFRSYGAEVRERIAAEPALGTPAVDLLAGFARAIDEPVKTEWRLYLSLSIHP